MVLITKNVKKIMFNVNEQIIMLKQNIVHLKYVSTYILLLFQGVLF